MFDYAQQSDVLLSDIVFDLEDVRPTIRALDVAKRPGPDMLPNKLIKSTGKTPISNDKLKLHHRVLIYHSRSVFFGASGNIRTLLPLTRAATDDRFMNYREIFAL